MSHRDRREVVLDLLEMRRPLEQVAHDLNQFPFDCEPDEVQTLTRQGAIRLLDSFVEEALPRDELEYWAMIVERRNDIAYEGDSDALKEMVYVLAHARANRPLDTDRAHDWIFALDAEAKAG